MTQPNRTPEDELEIKVRFPGLPVRPIGPGDDVVFSAEKLAEWILADRKVQATAMLEKGPDNLPPEDKERQPRRCHWAKGFNSSNVEWRSIIKEVGGLDE